MITEGRKSIKFILAGLWLASTLSFAVWWMILGLSQIDQIQSLLHEPTEALDSQRRMMLWEGATWAFLLLAGGIWLILLLRREENRNRSLKGFFAAFSHDIKTAITSLRLQAESIKEDLAGRELPALQRLVADTVRLHLQLENSLFLSQNQDYNLYLENLSFGKLLQSIRHQWPNIEIELLRDAVIHVDERAMKTVLSNLIHNSVTHGSAEKITFNIQRAGSQKLKISFLDDGKGFVGEIAQLGRLFHRHSRTSGSGVGLYVAQDLVERMGGELQFAKQEKGFGGIIELGGSLQ